jgi:HAD superfamily 5'-nucleotidase-like hydrolase
MEDPDAEQIPVSQQNNMKDWQQQTRRVIPIHVASATDLFCNREVEMEEIEAVGFDMDFTLAQYNEAFDLLAYEGAIQKLITTLHYPEEIKQLLHYQKDLCRRGCVIDKRRGNIIKLDQYRYVTNAEHGLTPLTREERKTLYQQYSKETELYTSNDYYYLDTPFSLVDACLFVQLVDLRDRFVFYNEDVEEEREEEDARDIGTNTDPIKHWVNKQRRKEIALFMKTKSYYQLWLDMRKCIDRCHFDGVIKHTVAKDPAKYIVDDPNGKIRKAHSIDFTDAVSFFHVFL